MKRICRAMAAMCIAANAYAAPLDHGDLVTLATRAGVTQPVFIELPAANPPFAVALYGGNDGALKLGSAGATILRGNFLIRTRTTGSTRATPWRSWTCRPITPTAETINTA